ncbi:hypothetical protein ROZALSC1DRAFT_24075 [Rozella allomycis CSF55]|uniref:Uncharacterized protein n=1 Tax=Rozella allomycis (strain CSF55) TaxID=988480 RepID=A0A4P9YDP1_ROZAC|nr:hypothetical protein ROZALSC1DRAFT_24075 [Rozella allomycis CSF55]
MYGLTEPFRPVQSIAKGSPASCILFKAHCDLLYEMTNKLTLAYMLHKTLISTLGYADDKYQPTSHVDHIQSFTVTNYEFFDSIHHQPIGPIKTKVLNEAHHYWFRNLMEGNSQYLKVIKYIIALLMLAHIKCSLENIVVANWEVEMKFIPMII